MKLYFSPIAKEVKNKLSGKHYSFHVAQQGDKMVIDWRGTGATWFYRKCWRR